MKQVRFILCLILCSGLLFSVSVSTSWAKAEYVMKVAGPFVAHDYWNLYTNIDVFKAEVEARSKGRIKVEVYGGNQLGKPKENVAQVKSGMIQMTYAADGHFTPVYPNIQAFSIPYLFIDRQIAWHIIDGKTAHAMMDDMAEKTGIRPLVLFDNGGFRNFSDSKRPLRTPADLKGLKIRTMPSPLHMQIVKDLGAAPTPIPFTELYSALQLKVVDGQENPVSVFRHPKLEEVQKYMILDGHVFSMTTYLINEKWFQSLPGDLRTAIDQSVQVARDVHNAISYLLEKKDISELRKMGVDVYDPPVEVKMEFRKLTQKSALDWLRKQDNIDQKWIDQLLAETKQVEAELGYSSK